jgi:hypothetical protein
MKTIKALPLLALALILSNCRDAKAQLTSNPPPPRVLPASYVRLARAVAQPATFSREVGNENTFTLATECTRLNEMLVSFQERPAEPEVRVAWDKMQPLALESAALLRRISELEKSKPSDLAMLFSVIELVVAATHDTKDDSSWQKLTNAGSAISSGLSVVDRIGAESDLSKLREQYREARMNLRTASTALFAVHERLVGDGVPRAGFVGLMLENNTRVASLTPDSPAAEAGIQAGDRVLEVEGRSTAGLELTSVVSLLRGNAGTVVRVRFEHAGLKTLVRKPLDVAAFGTEYHSSMNHTFCADYAGITNSSNQRLTHCILLVRRLDAERKHSTHLHYVDAWPAGSTLSARYYAGNDYHAGEAFDDIATIEVSLLSDQLRNSFTIDYSGPA